MDQRSIPRPDYPRPQFQRHDWLNLNGQWTYTFDFGESGMDAGRELFRSTGFAEEITVPFCPESELSGVGYRDFIPAMWYHRTLTVPAAWQGQRLLLHFCAVDYECEVFVDSASVGCHFGGTVSFTFDVTRQVVPGQVHQLVVRVKDATRGANQPGGKQCPQFKSRGCHYTRTTGIWQTVWIEPVDTCALQRVQIIPDLDGATFTVIPSYHATRSGLFLTATARAGTEIVATARVPAAGGVPALLALPEARPWSPNAPFLYDLELQLIDSAGTVLDHVRSYAGLRKVHIEGNRLYLNNAPFYQRLVLDQGFYPGGIWTAPTDEALKNDIQLAMQAGFNGARLHQKVFEERFHYWADKLGYLTWGETSSWGCDPCTIEGARNMLSEWREILVRDRNHPSIIAWTPWNETRGYATPHEHRRVHVDTYHTCRDLDPTRPVNDASGYLHQLTNIWTVHNYQQDPEILRSDLSLAPGKGVWRNFPDLEIAYDGQPYIVDEYGGIKWIPSQDRVFADNSWGYGDAPKTLDDFYSRLAGLTDVLLSLDHISGYCYTQLTDVEQEQNGIYNYDRTTKFDMKRIRSILGVNPATWDQQPERNSPLP